MFGAFWIAVLFAAIAPSAAPAADTSANPPLMTKGEITSIRTRIAACWDVKDLVQHPGVTRQAQVRVSVLLEKDGSVGQIETLPTPAHITDQSEREFHSLLAERSISAVQNCAPYILPPEKYESWRKITLNFDLAPYVPHADDYVGLSKGPLSDFDRKRIFGH